MDAENRYAYFSISLICLLPPYSFILQGISNIEEFLFQIYPKKHYAELNPTLVTQASSLQNLSNQELKRSGLVFTLESKSVKLMCLKIFLSDIAFIINDVTQIWPFLSACKSLIPLTAL